MPILCRRTHHKATQLWPTIALRIAWRLHILHRCGTDRAWMSTVKASYHHVSRPILKQSMLLECYITFRVRPRRNVYWPWPSVSLCVCLSLATFPHYCTDLDVTWQNGRGCPLVVHYWADLQAVHRFRCCDNTHICKLIALYTANAYSAEHEMSASVCTRPVPGCSFIHLYASEGYRKNNETNKQADKE